MRILTINAEDWYNGYISPQDRDWGRFEYRVDKWLIPMLDELDRRKIKAVVFCTGWLADNHPEIIRETARRGHEIGCNGYWHIEPNTMTREEFEDDTRKAKEALEKVTGKQVLAFRAPGFAVEGTEEWFFEVLKKQGFITDYSLYGNEPKEIAVGDGVIMEYPVSLYKGRLPFIGGGYFRLLPYWLIKRAMRDMPYVMMYFHPRDFDTDQPRWEGLSMKERFIGYVGLKGAYGKWVRLLGDIVNVNV